jgi:predicted alpha/beta superfamily hydrolase
MVGINNTYDRTAEYSPTQNGEKYSQFLIKSVKPFIDSTYHTLQGAKNTAVLGSSMGGIISFHLAWGYPGIFSMAGCLSPAF